MYLLFLCHCRSVCRSVGLFCRSARSVLGRSVSLFVCLSVCLSACLSVCPSVRLSLSVSRSCACLPACPTCLDVCVCMFGWRDGWMCLSACLSVGLPVWLSGWVCLASSHKATLHGRLLPLEQSQHVQISGSNHGRWLMVYDGWLFKTISG